MISRSQRRALPKGLLAAVVVGTLAFALILPPASMGISANSHTYPTAIRNVVLIVFENQEAKSVLSKGPYFDYLSKHYAYAANDYAICHPSAPNYVALTSGATYSQCGTDTHFEYKATNIADEVEKAHLTWAAYAESMPKACDLTNSYPYAVKHEPFLFYSDIATNSTRCAAHVVGLTSFFTALNASSLPSLSFVTPNLLDDGHDTNVSYADSWLRLFLSPLVNTTSFSHTAYLVVFDEGTSSLGAGSSAKGPTNSTGGGHVYLSIVSPLSKGIGSLTNLTSHYSVLTTTEWLLNLSGTGHHDSATVWPPIKSAFS